MCSSSPDTSGINAAAQANAKVAGDALAWYKQAYADSAPDRAAASKRAGEVSDAQMRAMGTATDIALKDQQYREQVFQPLERSLVSEANNYDTQDRRDQAAGKAAGDIELNAAGARASGERGLERMGVNPSDGNFAAMERASDIGLALGKSDAMNRARDQVRTVGHAMKMDAVSLGRGLPGQQATQASLALNAGNSAVGNAQVPLTIASQGASLMGQGFNTFISGNNSAGNLYGTAASAENAASAGDSAAMGGLGSAIGGIAIAV
jgi:hypothetical protein